MPIPTRIILFCCAFVISFFAIPLVRRIALRNGFTDLPNAKYKVHEVAVPRLGGTAIFSALVVVSLAGARILGHEKHLDLQPLIQILAIAGLIFLIGVYDDLKGLNAWGKFFAQLIVITIFWRMGFRLQVVHFPWFGAITISPTLSFALTTLGIAGLINAMNMIDGIDELAAGVGVIALLILSAMFSHTKDSVTILLAIVLGGATLGFFFHNLYPAQIFMGDSGSMLIGFVLGGVSLEHFNNASDNQTFWLPFLVLAMPIVELLTTIVRRLAVQQSPIQADLEHIHHKLLAIGLTSRWASALLHGVTFLFGLVSVILMKKRSVLNVFIVCVCYVLSFGGYILLTRIYRLRCYSTRSVMPPLLDDENYEKTSRHTDLR